MRIKRAPLGADEDAEGVYGVAGCRSSALFDMEGMLVGVVIVRRPHLRHLGN